jgi:16S rRNA (guanine966-N2)-methyltransferase
MTGRTAKSGNQSQRGRLRIVAGIWRSRLLEIADVPGLRPTAERVRETVFNWLTPHLAGARCLDLFAGTGALGLEALSRGAAEALFVEASPVAVRMLRRNIATLEAKKASVRATDARKYLLNAGADQFDIIFLDPPFADELLGDLCKILGESSILAANALVYIEEDKAKPEAVLPADWQILKTKSAGNVRFSLVKPTNKS